MPVLKVRVQGREESLPLKQDITILGRSTENAVYVDDRQASRNHCQVEKFAGGWKVVDLASRNGTRVNGVSVNQHVLKSGDRIEIGDAVVTFVDAPDETDHRIPGVPRAAAPAIGTPGGASPRMPSTGMPTPPASPHAEPQPPAYPPPVAYPQPPVPPAWPPAAGAPPYPPPGPAGYPQPYPYPPYGAPPPAQPGYAPPQLDPPTQPFGQPQGYPPPPAGYPGSPYPPPQPGYPPQPPGAPPAPHQHPTQPPAERKSHRPGAAPAAQAGNPGVMIGVAIVIVGLIVGAAIMAGQSGGGGSKDGTSSYKTALDAGKKYFWEEKWDQSVEELRKIPSSAREYKAAQEVLAAIAQKKRDQASIAAGQAAAVAWEALRPRVKKYDDGELLRTEEEPLKEELKRFISSYGKAPEAQKAADAYVRMGGKPEDVKVGGTSDPDLSKEAEAAWSRLSQRVEMQKKGELPPEEVDRLKGELRNFIVRYNKYPEASEAQQALRGLGRETGQDPPDVPPTPGGDPKNFGELKRLVDGLAGSSSYGEAVGLLDAWVKKDPTGPDAGPADEKIRDVKSAANNWYLGQEAQADTLAKEGKFKEAKALLEDAVSKLGEKWFFENTTAAKKKIAGIEKAMGGGK